MQVLQESRLIDRLDRPEAHRHRRELPELRHQPRMRVGGDALAVHLAAEVEHLLLGEAPFQERTRIDARRRMTLEIDQIAAVPLVRRVPEMVEAGAEQRAHRGEARDVSAQIAIALVGLRHHRHRVPAHDGAVALLEDRVPRRAFFHVRRNGVDVGGLRLVRQVGAGAARHLDQLLEQEMRALGTFALEHRLERIEPLLGFEVVGIVGRGRLRDGGHDFSGFWRGRWKGKRCERRVRTARP